MSYELEIKEMSKVHIDYYRDYFPDHTILGATETMIVLESKPGYMEFTPKFTIRDCGDHYIQANYSSFTRIDKETGEHTYNAEDK